MTSPVHYFIRHGQTDWNAERRFQGQTDIPINRLGRQQAAKNGAVLKALLSAEEIGSIAFVSSPLQRARQTMEIIRQTMALPPEDYSVEPTLKELSFGTWEGHTLDELRQSQTGAVDARQADKWNFTPPDGESYQNLCDRVLPWVRQQTNSSIIVCHGGIIRTLLLTYLGLTETEASNHHTPHDRIIMISGFRNAYRHWFQFLQIHHTS